MPRWIQGVAPTRPSADLVRNPKVLDGVAAHVALGDPPETVAVLQVARVRHARTRSVSIRRKGVRTPSAAPPLQRRCSAGAQAGTRDVQMTSRRMMFMKLSQLTRWPLYVSPLLSSTSCVLPPPSLPARASHPPPASAAPRSLPLPLAHASSPARAHTIGWPMAVVNSVSGSCVPPARVVRPRASSVPAHRRSPRVLRRPVQREPHAAVRAIQKRRALVPFFFV